MSLSCVIAAWLLIPSKGVHIEYFQRCVFLESQIKGSAKRLFLLDSGANRSVIDAATAKELSLKVSGRGIAEGTTGNTNVSYATLPAVTVDTAKIRGLRVTVQDL